MSGDFPEDLSRAIVDSAPDAILVVDQDGTILVASRRTEDLFGYAPSKLVGTPIEALLPTSVRDRHRSHREAYAAAPQARAMGTGQVLSGRHRDGHTFPVEVSLSPLRSEYGLRVIAAVRDVTEREAAAEALRTTEQQLATTAERERIAREVHDTVIQHLFAIGVTLQALEQRVGEGDTRDRLAALAHDLDRVIEEIRGAIFRSGPAADSPDPNRPEAT